MACLFSCFSISKHKKGRFYIKGTSSTDVRHADDRSLPQAKKLMNQEHVEEPSKFIAEAEEKQEVKHAEKMENKKQTEEPSEITAIAKEKHEERHKSKTKDNNWFENLPSEPTSDKLIRGDRGKEGETRQEEQTKTPVVVELVNVSAGGYQSGSRNGDSLKDLDFERFEEEQGNHEEKGKNFVIEESSESLFSLSIDSRKRLNSKNEIEGEREVSSPFTKGDNVAQVMEAMSVEDQNQNDDRAVESLLNPITEVSDWNSVMVKKEKLLENHEKENIMVKRCLEPVPDLSRKLKLADKEILVDTSLSSWLVESKEANFIENSDSRSPKGKRVRRVLGEVNLQEPKEEFMFVSKSNIGDQDDDVSTKGTIGNYLSCTEHNRNRMIII